MAQEVKSNNDGAPNLPKIVLGAMEFGRRLTLDESLTVTTKFLESGHQEIDTAYVYNNGDSERFIQEIITKLSKNDKDKNTRTISIATKLNPLVPGGFSQQGIESQLRTSLERLGTDCVDLLYLHWPDYNVDINQTLKILNEYYKQRKFLRFGLSNFPAWQVWYICLKLYCLLFIVCLFVLYS